MKYICSWSGGKDSTASIILAHENNEPLDIILFAEVMYSNERNISGENPRHMDFVRNHAKPLFESWGYQVEIVRAEKDYLDCFNHIIENPTKHIEHKDKKYGFPIPKRCVIKRDLKEKPIEDYYKNLQEEVVQYVGICSDEKARLKPLENSKKYKKISLLDKYGYTKEMTKQKCLQYELLSPGYELSRRGGCWFCPNAKLTEHAEIKKLYPDEWEEFIALEKEPNLAFDKWNVFGKTLEDIRVELLCF